jgi:hypothetical protein
MCQSLGKRNFSKKGLAAMCIFEDLYIAAIQERQALGLAGIKSLAPIIAEAKRLAETSELLQLSRAELESRAAAVKGCYSSWGSYSTFSNGLYAM